VEKGFKRVRVLQGITLEVGEKIKKSGGGSRDSKPEDSLRDCMRGSKKSRLLLIEGSKIQR